MTSVFRLFSPLQKNNRLRTPRARRRFRYFALLPPPSFPLSAVVNVSHVCPIVSLNESPSVPATCKMTKGATLDRIRPVEAPNPCRAPSCAPVAALAIRSRCGRARCLAAGPPGSCAPVAAPSPYSPVAVERDAWPPGLPARALPLQPLAIRSRCGRVRCLVATARGESPPSRLAPPCPVVRSHRIPEKSSPIGQIIVSFAYIPHF